MKVKHLVLFIGAIALVLSSCKPVYQCGQSIPDKKVQGSKRLKAVVNERDELCKTVELRDSDIVSLNRDIVSLKNNIADLEKQYLELSGEKRLNEEEFSAALLEKNAELIEKERQLREREQALYELEAIIARQDSMTQRLNDILLDAMLGFNADELSIEIINGKVYVSMTDKLLFKSGSVTVEKKGKEALELLANVLNNNPDIDVLIEGHTDNVPIKTAVFKDNWDLSAIRATSIVRILTTDYNIEPTRLTAAGRGEFTPRASNETPEGRASNRRTDIILSPKLDEIMQLLKMN